MTPPLCALDQRVVYSQRSQVTPSLNYQFERPDLPLNSVKENTLLTLTLNKNPATVLVLFFFFFFLFLSPPRLNFNQTCN